MERLRRYYDVNVFVYWLGGHPEHGERAKKWIREAEEGKVYTSSLTPYEVAVVLASIADKTIKDTSFVREVLEAIRSIRGLRIVSLTWNDYVKAARFVDSYDLEDALHLAVALRMKVDEIVSNDRDFDRGPLKRVF